MGTFGLTLVKQNPMLVSNAIKGTMAVVSDQLVDINMPNLLGIIEETGLTARSLALLTNISELDRSISRSGIQRILGSDGKNTPFWKVELLANVLKVEVQQLIKGNIPKTRKIALKRITQGIDLRNLFSGISVFSFELITEPGSPKAQEACLNLLKELDGGWLKRGNKFEQMQTNFRIRSMLDDLVTPI